MKPKPKEWLTAKTGNHQGLIIDQDGRNVAVSYRAEDAPLIAAAPDLLESANEAVNTLLSLHNHADTPQSLRIHVTEAMQLLNAAIAKAEETQ